MSRSPVIIILAGSVLGIYILMWQVREPQPLADEDAHKDMAELRELLGAWRDAKSSAVKAVVGWAVRGALALVLIGLAVKFGLTGLVLK